MLEYEAIRSFIILRIQIVAIIIPFISYCIHYTIYVLCYVMLCCVVLCYVMLCYLKLCYVMLCLISSCCMVSLYTFSLARPLLARLFCVALARSLAWTGCGPGTCPAAPAPPGAPRAPRRPPRRPRSRRGGARPRATGALRSAAGLPLLGPGAVVRGAAGKPKEVPEVSLALPAGSLLKVRCCARGTSGFTWRGSATRGRKNAFLKGRLVLIGPCRATTPYARPTTTWSRRRKEPRELGTWSARRPKA